MKERRKQNKIKKWLLEIGKHLIKEYQKKKQQTPKRRKGDRK